METRILIVDDDPFICRQLEELYSSQQYAVSSAPNAPEALRLLQEHEFSLAVVDLKIPGTDGIGLTREIRDRWPDLDVIMITGYASIKGAVEAIKQGASDYITKPFQKEEILLATEKILEKRRLLDEISYLRSQLSDRYSFANMVSRNRVMHEIFETIGVLAQNDATVLIYGESGTGEELGSNRRIKVNMRIICATNMELAQAVSEGRMREDFYYRINVVPLRIPPLRERIEDIPLLVGEFLRNSEMAREKGINRVSNKALSQLMSYAWPGNVRELGNVVERAILRTSGAVIREVDLPGHSGVGKETGNGNGRHAGYDYEVPLKEYLRRAEKDYLTHVLRKYRGGINLSAKHSLVDAATLHRKMKLHGLRREEYRLRGKMDSAESLVSNA